MHVNRRFHACLSCPCGTAHGKTNASINSVTTALTFSCNSLRHFRIRFNLLTLGMHLVSQTNNQLNLLLSIYCVRFVNRLQ